MAKRAPSVSANTTRMKGRRYREPETSTAQILIHAMAVVGVIDSSPFAST